MQEILSRPFAHRKGRVLSLMASLMLLAACGDEGGESEQVEDAQAGVRLVTSWHDPETKTAKESEGQTRYGKEIGEWVWFHPHGRSA